MLSIREAFHQQNQTKESLLLDKIRNVLRHHHSQKPIILSIKNDKIETNEERQRQRQRNIKIDLGGLNCSSMTELTGCRSGLEDMEEEDSGTGVENDVFALSETALDSN